MRSLQESFQMLASPLAVGEATRVHGSTEAGGVTVRRVGRAAFSLTIGQSEHAPEVLIARDAAGRFEPVASVDASGLCTRPYHVDSGVLEEESPAAALLRQRTEAILEKLRRELVVLPVDARPLVRYRPPKLDRPGADGITMYRLPNGELLARLAVSLPDENEQTGSILCVRSFLGPMAFEEAVSCAQSLLREVTDRPRAVA